MDPWQREIQENTPLLVKAHGSMCGEYLLQLPRGESVNQLLAGGSTNPFEKNMHVKLGIMKPHKIRGESVKKYLKLKPPRQLYYTNIFWYLQNHPQNTPSHHCPPSDGWKKSDAPQGKERKFRITKPAKMLIKLPLYTKKHTAKRVVLEKNECRVFQYVHLLSTLDWFLYASTFQFGCQMVPFQWSTRTRNISVGTHMAD